MDRSDDFHAPGEQVIPHLQELQHKMRNKLGVIEGTFDLMHPPQADYDVQEKEDIDRFKRASKSLRDLIEEISEVIGLVNRN